MANMTKEDKTFFSYTIIMQAFKYPDDDDFQYFAYCEELGHSACSYCGDTPEETWDGLINALYDYKDYCIENNIDMPSGTERDFIQ